MKYTDIIPQEPGYYWVTQKQSGIWEMARIIIDQIGLFVDEPLVVVFFNGTLRPLDDFCNSVDDTFLWIGPIEKPKDLEIE